MHPNRRTRAQQQKRVRRYASNSDCYEFFNLLTGPQLLEQMESLIPDHRERLFSPTETLSMFLAQALSADRSCQKAVNDAAIKRLAGGLPDCSTRSRVLFNGKWFGYHNSILGLKTAEASSAGFFS